ncbi:tape measure protein [Pseudomonas shahriarae]|uniref:tape measure protein n=1 Tax=Pseudomonas shahriarae TaxID=2745512 RepID=UPI0023623942|nr:tape measure protein [Pseudomonas shahriarae]MDD1134655.1 tape measure protein [Pseudomonas shahriarae]
MAGQTLRNLIVSVSAETSAYQREMSRAGRMGTAYFRTITDGNRQSTTAWRSQEAAIRAQGIAMQSLTSSVGGYAAAMVGALAVGNLAHQADSWNLVSARLKQATTSTADFASSQKNLFELSQRTGTSFEVNANLFSRSAASMREFGYSSGDAVSLTESLALGLKLSGATSEGASAAITQFSQALSQGVLRGEEFNSMADSGDRVLRALAAGMGVARSELKGMADKGLITIDKLVPALVGQLSKLREEYEKIPPTISGSMQVMNNAFLAWVGGADSATGSTTVFSKAIVFLADNLGLLALTGAGAAIGALTGKSLLAAQGALTHAAAMIQQRSEAIGVARATFTVADSHVIYTKAQLAAAQASVAGATGMKRLSLVQSELIPRQVAATAAINAQAVAQNNLNKAMALTSGRALLGVLGGPAGMAITAATVAASFYMMRDGANDAGVSMDSLSLSVEEYGRKWSEASKEQRRALLVDAKSQLGQVQQDLNAAVTEIEKAFYEQGPVKGKAFTSTITQLGELRKAAQGGAGVDGIVQSLLDGVPAGNSFRQTIEKSAGAVGDQVSNLNSLNTRIGEFTPLIEAATTGAAGFGKALNGALSGETVKAWERRIDALKEKASKFKDPTTLGEINRQATRDGLDKTPAGQALLEQAQLAAKTADAEERAKKAQDDARQSAKQRADEADRQAKQIQDSYSRTLKTLNEQADVHGRKTELAKIEFETSKGTLTKLDAAKKVELERAAIAVDHLNSQKSYAELLSDVQKGEDALLVTTRKRYQELARIKEQGGLTADQYAAGANAISKGSVEDAPKFAGLDASVGGASGELIKVAEADKELAKWHEKELARQKDLHDAKLTNEQQYLDRVRDINQQNTDQLKTMQSAYTSATLGIFSGMTGNVADMMGDMAGKSSAAYKIMFAASKASAIAQAIVNTQEASTKALTMGPIFGIPAASLITGLGYASIGIMAATAVTGFSEGGYTGPGGKLEPKGVVHGGEVVIRKAVVDQPGMKDYLIGLNARGYASGGFVGNPVATPSFSAPQVSASGLGAPQINISIKSDGSGGTVESTEGLQALGVTILAKVGEELTAMRQDIPKIVRAGIIQEKGQNGLLDPSNRRNT